MRAGFEGGQTPLYRRLPRRGFNHARFATLYEIVNVGDLAAFAAGTTVTREELTRAGLIKGTHKARLKVLGVGDLGVALTVVADKFSAAATQKITAAGGTCAAPQPSAAKTAE